MRTVGAAEVHELLGFEGLIEAFRQAHRGGVPRHTARHIFEQPRPEGLPDAFIILPAWQPGEGILAKLTTSFPDNQVAHGIPTVHSLYVFIDGRTGVPEAAIDGSAMIFRKTAADSALGASFLAHEDAETLLMVGAGGLAPYLVAAHRAVRPKIRRVLIWNRTHRRAQELARRLREGGVEADAVTDLDTATARADVISCATMATSPLLHGSHLKPGAHVDLVGSFTPEMREADDEVLRRATIFVDHRQCTERSGEFIGPLQRGIISRDDIRGDLFELCQGKIAGRSQASEVTMMKNGGGSYLDYFAVKYLMDRLAGHSFETTCAS